MFQTIFKIPQKGTQSLLSYLEFLHSATISEKIIKDDRSGPSSLWEKWASQTFVGFSTDSLLIQSGYNFSTSTFINPEKMEESPIKRIFNNVRRLASIFKNPHFFPTQNTELLLKSFQKFYPQANIPSEHRKWIDLNPNPYFRYYEAYLLKHKAAHPPKRMLEIGAGACTNVAFYHSLFPHIKTLIVDLPEMIPVGYAFLKSAFPSLRICLPNNYNEHWNEENYDVTFTLPYQCTMIPKNHFDLAINVSSFQEMEISVVNNYIKLIWQCLQKGGSFISVNQEKSRHISGNNLASCDFSMFGTEILKSPAPYLSWNNRTLHKTTPGIKPVFTQVYKN